MGPTLPGFFRASRLGRNSVSSSVPGRCHRIAPFPYTDDEQRCASSGRAPLSEACDGGQSANSFESSHESKRCFWSEGGFWHSSRGLEFHIALEGHQVRLGWDASLGAERLETTVRLSGPGSLRWVPIDLPWSAASVVVSGAGGPRYFRLRTD